MQAAASGVGSAAVQIAARAGARVIAAARSAEKAGWAAGVRRRRRHRHLRLPRRRGGGRSAPPHRGAGANVVLDTVGGEVFAQSLRQTGFAGRVVALANVALQPSTVDTRDFYPKNVAIHGFQLTGLIEHGYDPRPDLHEIAAGVASGAYRVPVEAAFPLSGAAQAHEQLERRANRGKIVLTRRS